MFISLNYFEDDGQIWILLCFDFKNLCTQVILIITWPIKQQVNVKSIWRGIWTVWNRTTMTTTSAELSQRITFNVGWTGTLNIVSLVSVQLYVVKSNLTKLTTKRCGQRMCLDVSVWGLMAGLWGLVAMGAFLPFRGRLVTVEAPGLPRLPSSIQLDAVVNNPLTVRSD